jgi:hypothetical protein
MAHSFKENKSSPTKNNFSNESDADIIAEMTTSSAHATPKRFVQKDKLEVRPCK